MILTIDSSAPECRLSLIVGDNQFDEIWQADRSLARDLLGHIDSFLSSHSAGWDSLTGLGVFVGPGSFTGLRIGLTVFNTIADSNNIPIVGGSGETWQQEVISKLQNGQNDQIVLPLYGSEANITKPIK